MPKPKYQINLTDEMKVQLRERVNQIMYGARNTYLMSHLSAERFQQMAEQNKPTNMKLLDNCYIGPTNMTTILLEAYIDVNKMSLETQSYYAVVLEEMFGLSTKFKYDKEENQFVPERSAEGARRYGDLFTFNEEDLELGLWDKICALFGIDTDHAKRVKFIQDSLAEQKSVLYDANKILVSGKKNEFLENNADLNNKNKEVIEKTEAQEEAWKKAFFGTVEAKEYKFDSGKTISPVSACIAMYKKEYKENICDKNIQDMDTVTVSRMQEIARKYLTYQNMKTKLGHDLMNMSTVDVKMLAAISQEDKFEVDYDKNVPDIKELPNEKLKNQARLQKNYALLKMKVELQGVFKGNKIYEMSDKEKAMVKESNKLKTEVKLYDDISKGKYENIKKHMKVLNSTIEYGEDVAYQRLLEDADICCKKSKNELKTGLSKKEFINNINNIINSKNEEIENKELDQDDGFGMYN